MERTVLPGQTRGRLPVGIYIWRELSNRNLQFTWAEASKTRSREAYSLPGTPQRCGLPHENLLPGDVVKQDLEDGSRAIFQQDEPVFQVEPAAAAANAGEPRNSRRRIRYSNTSSE